MTPSALYFRTFSLGLIFFVAVAHTMVSHEGGSWSSYPPRNFIVLVVAWIVTALLVGVAATRFRVLRSWPALIAGTIGGAFVVLWMTASWARPR